jgi:hypothetical protein
VQRSLLVMAAVFLIPSGAVWGQDSPPRDQTEQISILLERIRQLEQRVTDLEGARGEPAHFRADEKESPSELVAKSQPALPPATVQRAVPPATVPAVQEHQHESEREQVAERQMERHYPSLQIRGFADVDFSATDQKNTTSGFNLGQLDLHLASPLSQKISYFGEITLNARFNQYTVEVERSIIRYDYNDYFKLSFGRFHTPIGYWNTAFHHGAWLQTTIDRPFIVKFGGTFTPVHFVGFLAEGNIPSGDLGLSYNIGLGNGRGEIISRPGDAGDINNNRAWVAKIFARPVKLYGLEVGGSFYQDKITLLAPSNQNYREWIASGYVAWTKGSPEFLSEFDNVHHRNILTNQVTNSDAFYVQLAYRLPWFERSLKPYYRFEYAHMPLSERVFTHFDQLESIFGLRYDISSFAAFKTEYRNTRSQPGVLDVLGEPAINGVFFQTAFTF